MILQQGIIASLAMWFAVSGNFQESFKQQKPFNQVHISTGHLDISRIIYDFKCIAAIASRLLQHTVCVFWGDTDMPNIGIPTYNNFRCLAFYNTTMNPETCLYFYNKN